MSFEDKREKLEISLESVKSGSTIAIGGFSLNNSPMALIRELIRKNIADLTIIGPLPLGIQIDILLGAEIVKKVICPAIGFETYGSAPNFVRACKRGMVEFLPCDIGYTSYGLRAAAENLPFHPYPFNVIENTDLIKHNKNYKKISDPFSGKEVVIVPPIKPDIALIHTQSADISGNCLHLGSRAADDLLAEAADTVVVTTDEIIPKEWLRQNPFSVTIPKHFVTKLVEIPFGTHPLASHGKYKVDDIHFKKYLKLSKSKEGFYEYLDNMVLKSKIKNHYAYLRASGGKDFLDKLRI